MSTKNSKLLQIHNHSIKNSAVKEEEKFLSFAKWPFSSFVLDVSWMLMTKDISKVSDEGLIGIEIWHFFSFPKSSRISRLILFCYCSAHALTISTEFLRTQANTFVLFILSLTLFLKRLSSCEWISAVFYWWSKKQERTLKVDSCK